MNKSEAGRLGYEASRKTIEIRKEERRTKYYLSPALCKHCNSILSYKNKHKKFCNSSCSATYNNIKRGQKKYNCISCNIEIDRRNKKFCSHICQQNYRHEERRPLFQSGELSGRASKRFVIERDGHKCSCCDIAKWNGKDIVLDLEHIDGNSENNMPNNLALLCPNCHSQTPTYKGRNKGNGRHKRKQRYKEGKSY